MTELSHIDLSWAGPYRWPFKGTQFPEWPGAYLHTYEYQDGFLIYAAGITRRPMRERFREHTRSTLNGCFSLLDLELLAQGIRCEIWQGTLWQRCNPITKKEFESRGLRDVARLQMESSRIFAAEVSTAPRILERLEAELMRQLYAADPPFCDIPPRGMRLSSRRPHEVPISVHATYPRKVFALAEDFCI